MPPLFEATLVNRGHVREDSKGGVPMKVGKADREMSRRDFLKLGIAGSMVAVLLFAIGCLGGGDDEAMMRTTMTAEEGGVGEGAGKPRTSAMPKKN